MIDRDMRDVVELEVRELLESYGFPEDFPVLAGSARCALEEDIISDIGGHSVLKLMEIVDSYVQLPKRSIEAPFLLAIEHVHVIKGRGTVVTGRVDFGLVKVEDLLEVVGKEVYPTVCLGLEMFRKILDFAQVGDSIGILLKSIKKEDVKRGYIVAAPNRIRSFFSFDCKVYILTKKEGGRGSGFLTNYKPQFFFRTANVTGRVVLKDLDMVLPGDSAEFRVDLVEIMPLEVGLNFVMREGNLTLGAGVITKLHD
jgi:elongation factor Tu